MADFNPQYAVMVLASHLHTQIEDDAARALYLEKVKERLGRSPDDKKEASKLAVETAKMLLTIAVAVLVATATLVQFARNSGLDWYSVTILSFAGSVAVLVLSMVSGFVAISRIYNRADGLAQPLDIAWSTEKIKPLLNAQAILGLLALAGVVGGLFYWAMDGNPQTAAAISISIPAGTHAFVPVGSLTIEGSWKELKIRTGGNLEISVPPGFSPMTLSCK